MAPSKLRNQTLSELRKTFSAMMSPQWDLALEGKSDREVTEAARSLLAVQRARLRLGNARLAEIRDALIDNEHDLVAGITRMTEARRTLDDTRAVIDAATALLATIGRIIELA